MNIKSLLLEMNQRPIAYYPVYRRITGTTTAGILLSQIMYWSSAMDGKKFYKTDAEIIQETMLGEEELKNAKKRLKSLPFIEITLEGVPAKTFYSIDYEKLAEAISEDPNKLGSNTLTRSGQTPEQHNIVTENKAEIEKTKPSFSDHTEPIKEEKTGFGVKPQGEATAARDAPAFLVNHLSRMRMRDVVRRIVGGDGMKKERAAYGSKDRLVSDVLAKMIDSGFVHQTDAQTRSFIRMFVQGKLNEPDGQEFSEEVEAVAKECIDMVLSKRPFVSKVHPLRDFEVVQMKLAIENGMDWHLFSVIMQLLCESNPPEFCKVSYALGKFREENSEKIKTGYSARMKYLKMMKK